MTALTRQQLCAKLSISESTVRRLELAGLPYTPIGRRGKRYDLDECQRWLRAQPLRPAEQGGHQTNGGTGCQSGQTRPGGGTSASWQAESAYIESFRRAHLRVMPSA